MGDLAHRRHADEPAERARSREEPARDGEEFAGGGYEGCGGGGWGERAYSAHYDE